MKTKRPKLKAPFPWFGGKSRVAALIWDRLGNVDNFIIPFLGSGAELWARPHPPRIETVNDRDCQVANFWRATQQDPDQVAAHCDWPVNEADLHARHRWLVLSPEAAEFRQRMRSDPGYFDAKIAGWWCWGLCCWIGGGWCTAHGETVDGETVDGERKQVAPTPNHKGVNNQLPDQKPCLRGDSGAAGNGVHASGKKRPALSGDNPGSAGHGVHSGYLVEGHNGDVPSRMPTAEQCSTGGKGVHVVGLDSRKPRIDGGDGQYGHGVHSGRVKGLRAKKPHNDRGEGRGVNGHRPQLADAFSSGRGVNSNDDAGTCAQRLAWLKDWFARLRDRLRTVRVCCGDWLRVCDSESVTTRLGVCGISLDPPYALNLDRLAAWIRHIDGKGKPPKAGKSSSRDGNLYATDHSSDVDHLVARVHVYCRERGADRKMRIALCGYDGEHNALEKLGWECVAWAAQGGYGNRSKKGKDNAKRERIWFSPHCVRSRVGLFE